MIREVEFFNFGPFRGLHTIKLGAKAYAVTCRYEAEPKKSNGGGKSTVLGGIDFAATGRLNKLHYHDAEAWITRGEKEGHVKLTLDCGAVMRRSKRRGQAVQVRFTPPGGKEAGQEDAALAIFRYLGFDADDFRNVAYFEQGKMARLIHTDPTPRMEIVSGWFGLGLGERAEERAGDIAADLERELARLAERRKVLAEMGTHAPAVTSTVVFEQLAKEAREQVQRLREEHELAGRVERAQNTIDAQTDRIREGHALRDKIDAQPEIDELAAVAEEEIAGLAAARANLAGDVSKKKAVSLGQFDGACPVAPIECPAKKRINDDRAASANALEKARGALDEASAALETARGEHREVLGKHREVQVMRNELERQRGRVRDNVAAVREAKAVTEAAPEGILNPERQKARGEELHAAQEKLAEALGDIASVKGAREMRAKVDAEMRDLDAKIEAQTALVRRALQGREVFRAALRRVAERSLAVVEDDANAHLADAGIDLRVSARWEREARGWAKACDECGAAFPASAKVKNCERCGAARGAHTVQRLDFMLSDRSGALDDLGGITMQLAAGAWLLTQRNSPWTTAIIDEPFGACDAHNRHGLAVQLLRLLNTGTWRQSLVISHSSDTVAMFPEKITIVVAPDGSRRIEQ